MSTDTSPNPSMEAPSKEEQEAFDAIIGKTIDGCKVIRKLGQGGMAPPDPLDRVLGWLARLHFGRFGGMPMKIAWAVCGLVPVALFVTGVVMWWNRVLRASAQVSAEGQLS